MKKRIVGEVITRILIVFIVFAVAGTISCSSTYTSEGLQPGSKYKIIKPLYLMVAYYSADDKRVSKETARAYLHSEKYAKTRWVAYQVEVPVGTVMTIIGPAPKVWHLFFLADRYFVRLDPDLSHGLDIVLGLNRGIEGNLDGLNPELFSRL